jgi:hypothetical protein
VSCLVVGNQAALLVAHDCTLLLRACEGFGGGAARVSVLCDVAAPCFPAPETRGETAT